MNISRFASLLLVLALNATAAAAASTSLSVTALPGRPSRAGSGHSFTPVLNADGRFVAFVSQAKDLSTNGAPSPYLDVFVRDVAGGRTALVSVNTNGLGGGAGDSNFPTISSNGQFVAFESAAPNLVAQDTNGFSDVFVRDLVAGTTTLVSVGNNGVASANRASRGPLISADGRRVVFESSAGDLVANDTNTTTDVFLRDLVAGTTTLVSAPAAGAGTPNKFSDSPSISANGRYVAFRSLATNIVPSVTNQSVEIFVRDVEGATTVWASRGAAAYFTEPAAGWQSLNAVMSANGRFVAFQSARSSGILADMLLFRYDVQNDLLLRVGSGVSNIPPEISADGRYIAFQTDSALILADADNGTEQIVCAAGLHAGVEAWRAPVIFADGERLLFLGAQSNEGPWTAYAYVRGTAEFGKISATTNGDPVSVLAVSLPSLSADGRRVAFESAAADLTEGDRNGVVDVFLSDLVTESTELVSQRAPGLGAVTSMGRSILGPRSLSEYGRFIAFTSFDNTLVDGDENPWVDAFVRDRVTGTNQLLRLPGPSPLGPVRLAFNPILSTNGRYVVWQEARVPSSIFTAAATNIFWLDRETGASRMITVSGRDRNAPGPALSGDGRWLAFVDKRGLYLDVYIRDMLDTNAIPQLISVNRFGNSGGSGDSTAPAFSPDGRWVLFQSKASNLTTNQVPAYWQLFARNLQTARTRLVSTDATGRNGLSSDCSNAVFSTDSRYLVFQCSDFASSSVVYRHDLNTSLNRQVCSGCRNASVNDDGRFVAYQYREPPPGFAIDNIYLRDFLTGEVILASTNSAGTGGGNRPSFSPQISRDGRYVVFTTYASNLANDDSNQAADLFVYDSRQHATILLSRSRLRSAAGDGASMLPVMAPDGRSLAFVSFASDLAPGDFNLTGDIFVTRLGGPDTDADGLDDDGEQTYFSTLDRDGSGDFDGDGASDRAEFLAGTDPTNRGSILQVLVTSSLAGTTRVIHWVAEPGRAYRVQYKRDVSDSDWTYLSGTITATSTTASKSDASAPLEPRRFYRVLLEP